MKRLEQCGCDCARSGSGPTALVRADMDGLLGETYSGSEQILSRSRGRSANLAKVRVLERSPHVESLTLRDIGNSDPTTTLSTSMRPHPARVSPLASEASQY